MIHGAAGGVGTFAVQLAHWRGAQVIGTCSQSNAQFVKELGADEVLNYNSVSFEDKVKNVDVVFDTVGGDTLDRSWGIVRGGGTLVTIVGDTPEDRAKKFGIHGVSFVVEPNRGQLVRIAQLIDEGTVKPVVEAVYPLSHAREAYERGLRGHNRGKLVLKIVD